MKGLYVVVVLAIVAIAVYAYRYAVVSPYRIDADEARYMIAGGSVDVVLDVRTDFERQTLGSYPGSVHIPSADLETRMPQEYPNKDIGILVYCNTGHRARLATDKLVALGYKNTRYISSGYKSLL